MDTVKDNRVTARVPSAVKETLDTYFLTTARQHAKKGISRTFVAVNPAEPSRLIGYFTLTVAEIDCALFMGFGPIRELLGDVRDQHSEQ